MAPIFARYCNGCHNGADKEGELVLEAYDALLAGGANGAVLAPGKSADSRLIMVLTGKAEPAMPPADNERPTAEEIAVLAAWIDAGAKSPTGAAPDPTLLVTPKIKPTASVREAITSVAFAPDGKSLAVARYNTVELLALPERSLVRRLGPHRGRVNALRFAADGQHLLAAAGEQGVFGEATLWNAASGQAVRTFRGHQDSLYAAVLSPDGKLVATSSYDQQIKLWDASSGSELRTLSGHNDAVYDLAFRPDGKVLASASGDRTVKLWDVATGERLDTLGQPLKEQYAVAFSPDGTRVAAGGVDNRIRVWRVSAEAKENTNPIQVSRFAHEGAVTSLAYTSDGKTLVSSGEDSQVKVWDAEAMSERFALEGQSDWAAALAISPDGKLLAVGRLDGTLAFYDLAKGAEIPAPPPPKPDLAVLPVRGVRSGETTRLHLTGQHLADVSAIKASDPNVTLALVAAGDGTQLDVDLTIAAALPRGKIEIWAESPAGAGSRRELLVDNLAQLQEAEPNNDALTANAVALGSGTWGVLSAAGDMDHVAFDARAGQNLVFEVAAASLGSKGNLVLTLLDASGRVLADNNDFGGSADPLLAFRVPADGRYIARVSDLLHEGASDHVYRLSLGELPVVTAVYPLSVPANQETEVELVGFNLPADAKAKLPATASGEIAVPLDAARYRGTKSLQVVVGSLPEVLESEPNDAPAGANSISVPATVGGRIRAASAGAHDNDFFRFTSKAGQTWIVETDAARRGSPVDTVIEVLAADGTPLPRVLLQAVRDSNVTFRGIDGRTTDCRLTNWEEMQLNQLVYLNGEVLKLFRAPRGPDSGFLFYSGDGGARRCYYDTSATVHAVEQPCYIVEPHAPGTKLTNTGLPIFTVPYANDDDGQRRLGSDSRLSFTAPADGEYLVRVRDAGGGDGDRFAYRLTVRPPVPGFQVTLNGANPSIDAGSGKQFGVSLQRVDDFEGEVRVDIAGLPEGWRASSPLVIQAGHRDAAGVLFAAADAQQPTDEQLKQITVTAKATVGDKEIAQPVNNFGKIKLEPKPKLLVRLEPAEVTVAPGASVTAMIRLERNGFDGEVKFEVENLPHGVIVDNIGLNGVLLLKGETERQIFITADAWVPETSRLCFAVADQAGRQCSAPVMVHVRKDAPVAAVAPAAAPPAAK
ncbi:MAG: c-type cytochrome domain-containing protein [Pirellulales bacterium]